MKRCGETFIGTKVARKRNAVTLAEGAWQREMRYPGKNNSTPEAVADLLLRLVASLRIGFKRILPVHKTVSIAARCRSIMAKRKIFTALASAH
jgi:hypothetical protein